MYAVTAAVRGCCRKAPTDEQVILSVTHCAALKIPPRGKRYRMKKANIRKLCAAAFLTALAVVGSLFSFPFLGAKCSPVQHLVNIIAGVYLGPWWAMGSAFCASFIRNIFGLGSLMAFPGSMAGAFLAGAVPLDIREKDACSAAARCIFWGTFRNVGDRRHVVVSDSVSCYEQHRSHAVRVCVPVFCFKRCGDGHRRGACYSDEAGKAAGLPFRRG